jgi:hypothetical protein
MTALATISAAGDLLPPFLVFPGERRVAWMKNKNNIPDEVVFELTKSGWMQRETFLAYLLKQFVPKLKELKVVFPVVLFCDGVSSHISYDIISKQIIDSTVFLMRLCSIFYYRLLHRTRDFYDSPASKRIAYHPTV